MTFPSTPISTLNLDSDADDPSLAREDLLQAVETLNTIMDEANTAFGVCVLGTGGFVNQSQIPGTLVPTGDMTLSPSTGRIGINYLLRMTNIPKSSLVLQTDMVAGDIVVCSDADAGSPAICFYTGTAWKYLPAASLTNLV
jgi:hypothetical protein